MSWSRTRVLLPLLAALTAGACGPQEVESESVENAPLTVVVPESQPWSEPAGEEVSALATAAAACAGNNFADNNFQDTVSTGGSMLAIEWVPTASASINRIEVFTGEVAAPSAVALWSDNGSGQPLAPLAYSSSFTTSTTNSWQGANLNTTLGVTAGAKYWVVWDPSGGEQASVSSNATGEQQSYWGSSSGTVSGGASWSGPYKGHRWKFRMFCAERACAGNNHSDNNYEDNVSAGGPVMAMEWLPTASVTINRIEVFTGEVAAPNAVALWSDNGSGQPLAPLAYSSSFTTSTTNSWQGANLNAPVTVTAGAKYWVVWDPSGGEQWPSSSNATGEQQFYWGSYSGTVSGGTSWFGPFKSYRLKFRMFCAAGACAGNNYGDNNYDNNVSAGGPVIAIEWFPTASVAINRIEVFTGEVAAPNAVALWSDNGSGQPLAPLAYSSSFTTSTTNSWQGANLNATVGVTAGAKYWVVWDPSGGEQTPVSSNATGEQQFYWGSSSGTVSGGTSWFGPFKSFRWKFRMFCAVCGQCGTGNSSELTDEASSVMAVPQYAWDEGRISVVE